MMAARHACTFEDNRVPGKEIETKLHFYIASQAYLADMVGMADIVARHYARSRLQLIMHFACLGWGACYCQHSQCSQFSIFGKDSD